MFAKQTILTVLAVAMLVAPAAAAAGDDGKPWEPRKFSRDEIIEFGTFDQTPFELPWRVERIEEVPTDSRIDFRHVLDVEFETAAEYFDSAYSNQKAVLTLKKQYAPAGKERELFVYGLASGPNSNNYTLGNKDLQRQFTIELKHADGDVMLIFKNMAFTRVFGAGVPGQAPFKPVDAEPITLGRDTE